MSINQLDISHYKKNINYKDFHKFIIKQNEKEIFPIPEDICNKFKSKFAFMKYRCIKEFKLNDKVIANVGDIIILGPECQLYNITTTMDHQNFPIQDIMPYLENISDEIKYHSDISPFQNILNELANIYKAKNADYGNSFDKSLDEWGLQAAALRMEDKLNRFKNIVKNGSCKVKDESMIDTLKDLANYAIMTIVYLQK